MLNEQTYSGWQEFANQNNLTFKPSNSWLMREANVTGDYYGHSLRLETFTRSKTSMTTSRFPLPSLGASSERITHTRMILKANNSLPTISSSQKKLAASREFDMEKMVAVLMPLSAQQVLKGQIFTYDHGREIVYEREHIVGDAQYLQFVLNTLKELMEVYPQVIELGGETVPGLLQIARRFHPLQHVAAQLLSEIGKDTEKHLKQRVSDLLCSYCLVHCGPHQLVTPWTGSITYYGCKACGQSREFISVENHRLIVILDSTIMAERSQHNNVIRVNWMIFRQLFDFDEVEIVHATDEDVEYFAVQVGNDTDSIRHRGYKQMRCTISADGLSENTIRILQHTFGQVEKKAT